MSYLRESVEQQKQLMIRRLASQGIVDSEDPALSEKTLTELLQEYGDFFQDFQIKRLSYYYK